MIIHNSSSLAPHYKAAAKNLQGIVKMGAVDCDDDKNRAVCAQYDIKGNRNSRLPTKIVGSSICLTL